MKLKYGDVVVFGSGCVGIVRNAGVNQECLSIEWVHPKNHPPLYYQPKTIADKCEVVPKDVAENLIALYKE